MKRPMAGLCRRCGCTDERSCSIVTQVGIIGCEWHEPGLCTNPNCLIAEASALERPTVGLAAASRLRELADNIRRRG